MNIKELIEAEKKKGVSLREMARRLRWSDVDFERGTVNLIQKGGSTKSLPMGAAVVSSLRAIAPLRETRPKDPARWSFCCPVSDAKRAPIFVFVFHR